MGSAKYRCQTCGTRYDFRPGMGQLCPSCQSKCTEPLPGPATSVRDVRSDILLAMYSAAETAITALYKHGTDEEYQEAVNERNSCEAELERRLKQYDRLVPAVQSVLRYISSHQIYDKDAKGILERALAEKETHNHDYARMDDPWDNPYEYI